MARTDTLPNFLTDVANAIREKTGSTERITASDFDEEIKNIPTGGDTPEPEIHYTGHVDREGLTAIGWTEDDINYFQEHGIFWNEEQDDLYKVTDYERANPNDTNNKYYAKTTGLDTKFASAIGMPSNTRPNPNFSGMYSISCIPELTYASMSGFTFANCYGLQHIPFFDTSSVTTFKDVFKGCYSLSEIPFFDTSNVTSFSSTFNECHLIKTIPLFDTHKVEKFDSCFYNCRNLRTVPALDMSNCTSVVSMFYGCSALITTPDFDASKLTTTQGMFNGCSSLKTIGKLNAPNITNTNMMFSNCYSLKAIPELATEQVKTMESMFSNCYSLKTIPQLDTSNCTSVYSMFNGCTALQSIPKLNFGKVNYASYLFQGCSSLMTVGGFEDYGKAFTQQAENFSNYTLDLYFTNIRHDGIMNIINNLYDLNLTYDVANGGTLYKQKLRLNSTAIRGLTDAEKAIATAKGWTIST